MPPQNDLQLPFLTRHMLEFAHGLSFSLRLTSQSDLLAGLTIRGMTREGVFSFNMDTAADGSATTNEFRIPDVPIFVSVIDQYGMIDQGASYVSLSLVANGDVLYQLCSGFVYKSKTIGWPATTNVDIRPEGGKIEEVVSVNPAAGAECSITVPSSEIWKINNVYVKLATDANVADRRVHIRFEMPGHKYINTFAKSTQAASKTYEYSCCKIGAMYDDSDSSQSLIPLPQDLWVDGGDDIITETQNIQVGDDHDIMRISIEKFFTGVATSP